MTRACLRWAAFYAAISVPAASWAHGGQPQVLDIVFMPQLPAQAWAVTDNQGLFVAQGQGTRWLCEDSIEPGESVRAVGLLGDGQARWILSTDLRLYQTDDGGCTFTPMAGALADQRSRVIAVHPDDPDEALVGTDTLGGNANDVYRTTDGGRTWAPAGLKLPGQITDLHRATADPRRIYLMHEGGGERSDDGGVRFDRIKLGPRELDAQPDEFKILGTSPMDADVIFGAIERFDTLVVRSDDGGDSWEQVLEVPDFPLTLVMAANGRDAIIHSPFEGLHRSSDAGLTWQPGPLPVDRLGCLRRAPGSDRLWGCTNVFFGGPWALGISDDFGRTWRPHLTAFEDVERWSCPPRTLGRDCCQHLCPGLPPGGECPDATAEPGPQCGGPEPTDDMGVMIDMRVDMQPPGVRLDAAVDGGSVDMGIVPDMRPIDAQAVDQMRADKEVDQRVDMPIMPEPEASTGRDDDDCAQRPGDSSVGWGWWVLLAALRRRRR